MSLSEDRNKDLSEDRNKDLSEDRNKDLTGVRNKDLSEDEDEDEDYPPKLKGKIVLAAMCNEKTVAELSSEYGIEQTVIEGWIKEAIACLPDAFSGKLQREQRREKQAQKKRRKKIKALQAQIEQLTMERDFLAEIWENFKAGKYKE